MSSTVPTRVRRLAPLAENVGEARVACLVAMVQGNHLVLSAGHWAVATRTGLAAGLAAMVALWLLRTRRRWLMAVVLGAVTAFAGPGSADGP